MIRYAARFERAEAQTPAEALEVARRLISPRVREVEGLAGGFRHVTLRLIGGDTLGVLRLSRDGDGLAREVALTAHLQGRVDTPVMRACGRDEATGWWGAWMPWVDGARVDALLARSDEATQRAVLAAVGRALAALHEVRLSDEAGFLDTALAVDEPLGHTGRAFWAYSRAQLARPRVRERLGARDAAAVDAWLDARAWLFEGAYRARLVHSDFNTKNLLAVRDDGAWGGWRVVVLDWEFALSADPLVDLGNLLRFEHDLPGDLASEAVTRGYVAAGGVLPDGWREIARALDLSAMLEMLARDTAGPRTLATARGVILETTR